MFKVLRPLVLLAFLFWTAILHGASPLAINTARFIHGLVDQKFFEQISQACRSSESFEVLLDFPLTLDQRLSEYIVENPDAAIVDISQEALNHLKKRISDGFKVTNRYVPLLVEAFDLILKNEVLLQQQVSTRYASFKDLVRRDQEEIPSFKRARRISNEPSSPAVEKAQPAALDLSGLVIPPFAHNLQWSLLLDKYFIVLEGVLTASFDDVISFGLYDEFGPLFSLISRLKPIIENIKSSGYYYLRSDVESLFKQIITSVFEEITVQNISDVITLRKHIQSTIFNTVTSMLNDLNQEAPIDYSIYKRVSQDEVVSFSRESSSNKEKSFSPSAPMVIPSTPPGTNSDAASVASLSSPLKVEDNDPRLRCLGQVGPSSVSIPSSIGHITARDQIEKANEALLSAPERFFPTLTQVGVSDDVLGFVRHSFSNYFAGACQSLPQQVSESILSIVDNAIFEVLKSKEDDEN